MKIVTETPVQPGSASPVDMTYWEWSTGETCGLCGCEVELVHDEVSIHVECSCGPALVLA